MPPFHHNNASSQEPRASTSSLDDDYDLSAMMVADGFRPTGSSSTEPTISISPPSVTTADSEYYNSSVSGSSPSLSSLNETSNPASTSRQPPAPRPSSISKPPRVHDSFSLRHDGAMGPLTPSHSSRTASSSHDPDDLRPESPYAGPSGPSHSYQMYPHRTLSVATTSTAPVSERSYAGPQRPTHPYGLYTQNTAPVEPSTNNSNIPVGFVGTPDDYQRRIGPDGEEVSGMIGPLGHTEELPPYTRYPEEAYSRKPAVGEDVTRNTSHAEPAQPIPGAGGIGLATRNPEFESRDDLNSPQSRLSTRSVTSDTPSSHEINTAAGAFNEKQEQEKKWQRRARKRLFGVIPYWAICLTAVSIVILAVILGAVIGTLFAREGSSGKKPDEDAIPIRTTTAPVDTKPLPTKPADLPPLELGTFTLPPLTSSNSPITCFSDVAQAQAWACDIKFNVYSMIVRHLDNGSPVSDHTLQLIINSSSHPELYTFGAQPPSVEDPIRMNLVNDTFAPDRGPAWFGHIEYNKTVVITEDRFPNVGSISQRKKRDWWGFDPVQASRTKGVMGAEDGDRPWICTWPGTILEVFIYPSQNNSISESSSSYDPESSSLPESETSTKKPTGTSSSPNSTPTRGSRLAVPPYPQIIKIEESRLSDDDSRAAVCHQVEVINNGKNSKPVIGDDGNPIEVIILENQRLVSYHFEESNSKRRLLPGDSLLKREDETYGQLSECGCMWWFT